jgi:hypothetical protein
MVKDIEGYGSRNEKSRFDFIPGDNHALQQTSEKKEAAQ